ncbi:hypothetical protein PSAB6_50173 [Paraburkholderia sabiae]|nr:hypothetical protein PSAB6_50173 [Paraburkholderia sabiae]
MNSCQITECVDIEQRSKHSAPAAAGRRRDCDASNSDPVRQMLAPTDRVTGILFMSTSDKRIALEKVVSLEARLRSGLQSTKSPVRPLSRADCADARSAVDAARYALPTIIYSTLLQRIDQVERSLTSERDDARTR